MKLLISVLILFCFQLGYSAGLEDYISQSEMMLYSPSVETVVSTSQTLLKRFYGKNYVQMSAQISADSRSIYGLDIFNLKEWEAAGVAIKKPVAFVHISNQAGYLLVPVNSRKTIEGFIRKNITGPMRFKVVGDYIALSENQEILSHINATNKLSANEGFSVCADRLNFKWDKIFVWIESKYLSVVSSSIGVSSNIKIPYGFMAFTLDFLKEKISVKSYAGILSSQQIQYMQNMRSVSAQETNDIIDHIWGNPAMVGNFYLNMPMVYKYYTYIDTINILGLKGLAAELWDKYRVNVERDLINNSDGRFKLVVDKFDSQKGEYVVYGSIGVKNTAVADAFVDSMKSAILKTDNKLYSFDLFTKPFYHYQSTNYSIYYGLIDNDLLFSSDKDSLLKLVQNVYESKNGYLDSMPQFFRDADMKKDVGYYIVVDVQSLYSSVKTGGFELSKDLLIGIQDIHIYGYPDKDEKPYGWSTFIDINYYTNQNQNIKP